MSESPEEFTGGSSYISGGSDAALFGGSDASLFGGAVKDWSKGARTAYVIVMCLVALAVVACIFIVIINASVPGMKIFWDNKKPERLTVTVKEDPERMRERKTVTISDDRMTDGSFNAPTTADVQAQIEVNGNVNNVARDPAVQKVVGNYSDFRNANNPQSAGANQRRKGSNHSDAGGNRFAGSETHANQEGSLWTKPVQQGSFVERMSAGSHNDWSGKFSETGLDPNKMYVEDNQAGQPMYSWGPSPARNPRGKTDILLGAAAAGF
jgi:hypothetical protein